MERQFFIPLSVATVIHVGLLFGFPSSHAPKVAVARAPRPAASPVPRIEVVPPPETTESDAAPQGVSETAPPTSPEPPTRDPGPGLTIEVPRAPSAPSIGPMAAFQPFGRPDGLPNATGFDTGMIAASQLDNPPRARVQTPPIYPYQAKRDERRAEVIVEFVVDENGRVVSPRVTRSTDTMFDAATLQAVSKWRFDPGTRNGRVVRFRMAVPVVFNLND